MKGEIILDSRDFIFSIENKIDAYYLSDYHTETAIELFIDSFSNGHPLSECEKKLGMTDDQLRKVAIDTIEDAKKRK